MTTTARGCGRRRVDSMNPEPFALVGDCPRCGHSGMHLLGHIFNFRDLAIGRVIGRDCQHCDGRWWEKL